ncbi:MAG TPA: hypothetical protein VLC51_04835, partial [Nitrospira sp.]|nr:hypothetical protein [Nitrospira sp.]
MRHIFFSIFLMTALASFADPKTNPPDKIFVNGDIYPGAFQRAESGSMTPVVLPRVQAIAVSGDRVLAAGTNDEIRKLKGKHTEVIDLGGEFVMPGFNDAH